MGPNRRALMDAGHMCIIPRCPNAFGPLEIHHIDENPSNNDPENLVPVCGQHQNLIHYGTGKNKIDRKALKNYKNLARYLSDRFSRIEMRIVQLLARGETVTFLPFLEIFILALKQSELIELKPVGLKKGGTTINISIMGISSLYVIELTEEGKIFVDKWMPGREDIQY